MRWPWRRRLEPGMVRVSRRELCDLLQASARARELELQIARAQAETLALAAPGVDRDQVPALLEALPMTTGGELHEVAFGRLVDAAVWERWESQRPLVAAGAGRGLDEEG